MVDYMTALFTSLRELSMHCQVTGSAVLWEMCTSHLVDIGLDHMIYFGQWNVRQQNACLVLADTLGDIALDFALSFCPISGIYLRKAASSA